MISAIICYCLCTYLFSTSCFHLNVGAVVLEFNIKRKMEMTVLPPAPNWYSAQILCSSNKGYVAYGAKNNIVVLKCKPQNHFIELTNLGKNEGEDQGKHYQ